MHLMVILLLVSSMQLCAMNNGDDVLSFEGEFYDDEALRQYLNIEQAQSISHELKRAYALHQQNCQLQNQVPQWNQQEYVQPERRRKKRRQDWLAALPDMEKSLPSVPAHTTDKEPKEHVMTPSQISDLISQVALRQEKNEKEQKDTPIYTLKVSLPQGFSPEQVFCIMGKLWLKQHNGEVMGVDFKTQYSNGE